MKRLNVKRVVAVSVVAGMVLMAAIMAMVDAVTVDVDAHIDAPIEQHQIDNVVAQVTQYCTNRDGKCGFYKSQEIVKWMDEEDVLFNYTVEEAQRILDVRDSNK